MRLKHYQEKVLSQLKEYLGELVNAKKEYDEVSQIKPHLARALKLSAGSMGKSD